MGAPGYAVFCSNGHLCKSVGHHEINDQEPKCDCGSKKFYTQVEWMDDDYPQYVPEDPIGTEIINGYTRNIYAIRKLITKEESYR